MRTSERLRLAARFKSVPTTGTAHLIFGLDHFAHINRARGIRFHANGIEEWTALEWAGAMTGEAGECANACKKLRRMELSNAGHKSSVNNFPDRDAAIKAIAGEIAGTFIYLDLLAARLGIDLGRAIIDEFNRVSERENFPERL